MSDALALPPPPPDQVAEEEPHVPTRRLLVFDLGSSAFACDMDSFREIVPTQPMTRLPGAPDTVCGLINLRGTFVTFMTCQSISSRPRMGRSFHFREP